MTEEVTYNNDVCVFLGRQTPPHLGHKKVIQRALKEAQHVVLALGSAGHARTVRHPFTFYERKKMVESMFSHEENKRIHIIPIYDYTYQDSKWVEAVQRSVRAKILSLYNPLDDFSPVGINDVKVSLIGADKDMSSYYLYMFPQWGLIEVPVEGEIHATNIRNRYFQGTEHFERWFLQDVVLDKPVYDFMLNFMKTPEYVQLKAEYEFVTKYKEQWVPAKPVDPDLIIQAAVKGNRDKVIELLKANSGPPYPVKHVTVDAVVEQSGHILLVRRRSEPGRGKWAIPGGHLEVDEKIIDGIIRELKEETKLGVPEKVLKGSLQKIEVFDDPHRSTIGRVITHAGYFKLADGPLPKVKGSDDADKAKWVPVSEIFEADMYDDHFHVINKLRGA